MLDRVRADPAFRRGMPLVSDRRRLGATAMTPNTLHAMTAYARLHREDFASARWAIVLVPAAEAEYGMIRMAGALFEAAQTTIDVRPFTDLDQAVRWVTAGAVE